MCGTPFATPPRMDAKSDSRFVMLAAIDGSAATDHVVASAARLSRMIDGAELHLLHTVDRVAEAELSMLGDAFAEREERRRLLVEAAATRARDLGTPRVITHRIDAKPTQGILQLASDIHADLVLVGTHGRKGVERFVMGSVAEAVVRHASCPVIVVREKNYSATAPEIEPPCADCLETQRATRGAKLWCSRHAEHHPRAHLHYEAADPYGTGSMLVRP
jgi:nucleotide-binding universal stress UspA family protein